jgi:ion channel POLLUX/CASTOR
MACAVSAGVFLPFSRGGQYAARASESAVNALAGSQVSRRAVTYNSLRQAAGASVLRVLPGSIAMASAPAGITSKSAVAAASSKFHARRFSIQDRVLYSVSEFLMWNSGARVLALLALAIVFIYIGSLVFARLDPDGLETNESPFWMAARSYLNPLEDDYRKNSLRVLSVTMATCGIVFFGILVGMVTEAVESGIAAADGGSARVVAAKHTLICGWNHNTPKIITDINAVSGDRKIVVLVAESEKETMMEELREALSEDQQKRISVSVRTGTPVLSRDLEKVAASRADKIILSAGRGVSTAESDRRILSRALALRANIPLFSGDIVAELSSSRDESILQSIFESTRAKSVECVSTERLLFRFIAQAVRQVGLADCVAELMGENKSTVFHVLPLIKAAPNLVGMNFHDVRPTAIPGAIIAGFVDPGTGKVVIAGGGGSVSHALSAQTEILLLGVPSTRQASIASLSASASATDQIASKRVTRRPGSSRRSAENILVCGWRSGTMKDFLTELDSILPRGSSVTIVDDDAPDLSKKSVASELKMENIALSTVLHNPDDYSTLEQVLGNRRKTFDHVLVMSSALGQGSSNGAYSGVEEDSKALTTLCYIHDLLGKRHDGGALTTVTVEFVSEVVAEIARANKSVANVILPHSLSAHIAAQTCRDSRLNGVFSEILSQDGKEVYLRPVSTYLPQATGGLASFASISTDAASERDEIVLGFISKGETVLNPAGNMRFGVRAWSPDDRIVVLAD